MSDLYKSYKSRFAIAAIVTIANLTNQVVWASFASIATTSAAFYDTTALGISMMSLIYMITFIPVSPISSWVLDEKGIRFSILIGSTATFLGASVKYASGFVQGGAQRYAICLLGQTIASIGQPFLCNAPTKVAAKWFPPKERIMANACMTLGNLISHQKGIPVGISVSLGMSPVIVSGDPSKIPLLNLIIMMMALFSMILSLFTKHSPKSPPSASAEIKNQPFWEGVKALFKNYHYVLLAVIFGLLIGIYNVYYILPYGFTEGDAGKLGIITVVVGLLAALLLHVFLVYYPYYAEALRVCAFIATLGTVLFLLGMIYGRIELLYIGAAAIGSGAFPIEPISLELGVESTWPIAEGISAGTMYIAAQVFGIIFFFSVNALGNTSFLNAFIFNICVYGGSSLLTLFYVNEKKRLNIEMSKNQNDSTSNHT